MHSLFFSRNRSSHLASLLIAFLITMTALWGLRGGYAIAWIWALSFILILMLNTTYNTTKKVAVVGHTYDRPGDRICPAAIVTSVLILMVATFGTMLTLPNSSDLETKLFGYLFLVGMLIVGVLPKRMWELTQEPVIWHTRA